MGYYKKMDEDYCPDCHEDSYEPPRREDKGYDDCCKYPEYPEYPEYSKPEKHRKPKFPVTILKCGHGAGVALPVGSLGNVSCHPPGLVVGNVTIDTRGLVNPTVKIDFSSLINFRVGSTLGDFFIGIIFQLSRTAPNGHKIPLGTWLYEKEVAINAVDGVVTLQQIFDPVTIDIRDPFSFTWCECHDCTGCYVYTVEIIDFTTSNIENATITNVGINAEASGFPRD